MIEVIETTEQITYGYIYAKNQTIYDVKTYLKNLFPQCNWHSVTQKHTTEIYHVGQEVPDFADGLITPQAHTGCIISTADCLPILLACEQQFVLIHAGWLGLAHGIVKSAYQRLKNPIKFIWIGPHNRSYTRSTFDKTMPDHIKRAAEKRGDLLHLNLKKMALSQLPNNLKVYDCNACTLENMDLPSYRRGDGDARIFNFAFRSLPNHASTRELSSSHQ